MLINSPRESDLFLAVVYFYFFFSNAIIVGGEKRRVQLGRTLWGQRNSYTIIYGTTIEYRFFLSIIVVVNFDHVGNTTIMTRNDL